METNDGDDKAVDENLDNSKFDEKERNNLDNDWDARV